MIETHDLSQPAVEVRLESSMEKHQRVCCTITKKKSFFLTFAIEVSFLSHWFFSLLSLFVKSRVNMRKVTFNTESRNESTKAFISNVTCLLRVTNLTSPS